MLPEVNYARRHAQRSVTPFHPTFPSIVGNQLFSLLRRFFLCVFFVMISRYMYILFPLLSCTKDSTVNVVLNLQIYLTFPGSHFVFIHRDFLHSFFPTHSPALSSLTISVFSVSFILFYNCITWVYVL